MTNSYSTEVVYKVYDDEHGVHVTVGPDRDIGGYVELYTVDKKSVEFFGELRLVLPPDMAEQVGRVLIACAERIKLDEDVKKGRL